MVVGSLALRNGSRKLDGDARCAREVVEEPAGDSEVQPFRCPKWGDSTRGTSCPLVVVQFVAVAAAVVGTRGTRSC